MKIELGLDYYGRPQAILEGTRYKTVASFALTNFWTVNKKIRLIGKFKDLIGPGATTFVFLNISVSVMDKKVIAEHALKIFFDALKQAQSQETDDADAKDYQFVENEVNDSPWSAYAEKKD